MKKHLKISRKTEKKDVYQIVTDAIISKLESGIIPWKNPYLNNEFPPINFKSKKAYNGINFLLLSCSNFSSPFFLTFKQITELGGRVKPGSKSIPVVFWKMLKYENVETEKNKNIPFLKYSNVFNADQIEGIDFPTIKKGERKEAVQILADAQKLVDNMPNSPRIVSKNQSVAYYSPLFDTVNMPNIENINGNLEYYSTLFHELIHSTGHSSRLNRDLSGKQGSAAYAKEELVAEMGAAFLSANVGLENVLIENSTAYIQSWITRLKNDKKLLIEAAGKAQKAAKFILDEEEVHEEINEEIAA